jgi:hypothetical protein
LLARQVGHSQLHVIDCSLLDQTPELVAESQRWEGLNGDSHLHADSVKSSTAHSGSIRNRDSFDV